MMHSLASIRYIKSIWMIFVVILFVTACETFVDASRPLPPSEKLWAKDGLIEEKIIEALSQCSTKNDVRYEGATLSERIDIRSLCMLRKGFKYVPQPKGWRNICAMNTFEDSIACQSTRWGFTLPPEK